MQKVENQAVWVVRVTLGNQHCHHLTENMTFQRPLIETTHLSYNIIEISESRQF